VIELDIGTIQVVAFATNLATAYFLWMQRRPPVRSAAIAARLWSLGFTAVAFGSLLVALREVIPGFVSVVVSDMLIVGGFATAILGTRAFLSRPVTIWPLLAIVAAVGLGVGWFYLGDPDARMRLAVTMSAGAALCFWLVVSLRPWKSRRQIGNGSRIPAAGISGVFGIVLTVVTVEVVSGHQFDEILNLSGPVATTVAGLEVVSLFYALWALSLLTGRMSVTLRAEVRRRDRLISLLAHDLKTPFNSLVGGTEAMRHLARMGRTESALEMADDIHVAARQAHDLVDSLLAWTQSQPRDLEREPVALDAAVAAAHAPLASAFEAKGVNFESPGGRSDIVVLAHPLGVETIVRNLLANALKFTRAGGTVGVDIGRSGGQARLVIRDDGVGMAGTTLEKVNAPDIRYSSSGTSGEKGTGLGLTFCRDLVASYRGTMTIESAPGAGTSVTVTLPLAEQPAPAGQPLASGGGVAAEAGAGQSRRF
jgi:signal transduction histidine kinase